MIAVDLHIHSALSPCADDDMTPSNIAAMASLKGLDMIAVTDHNTAGQCRAAAAAAARWGVGFLPGIEVTSREDVHVLCYFPQIEILEAFAQGVEASLQKVTNRPEFFGNQLFYNEVDALLGHRDELLLTYCGFSVDQLAEMAWNRGGIAVPAHIDKQANGILSVLGAMPQGLKTAVVEVFGKDVPQEVIENNKVLRSSDAHKLGAILERNFFLPLESADPSAVIAYFRGE
jgi:hypothetical protein